MLTSDIRDPYTLVGRHGNLEDLKKLASISYIPLDDYAVSMCIQGIVRRKDFPMLQWLHEQNKLDINDTSIIRDAGTSGATECLEFLLDKGYKYDKNIIGRWLLSCNQVESMKILRAHGCGWDDPYPYAPDDDDYRHYGNDEVLNKRFGTTYKYLADNGCPWVTEILETIKESRKDYTKAYECLKSIGVTMED